MKMRARCWIIFAAVGLLQVWLSLAQYPQYPTVTSTPGPGTQTLNPAVIWGPIAGVAGAAAVGGIVAGSLVAVKEAKAEEALQSMNLTTTTMEEVKFREGAVQFRETGDQGSSSGVNAKSSSLGEDSSINVDSSSGGKSSSGSQNSAFVGFLLTTLFLLACLGFCTAILYACNKPKKSRGRRALKAMPFAMEPNMVTPVPTMQAMQPNMMSPMPTMQAFPMQAFPVQTVPNTMFQYAPAQDVYPNTAQYTPVQAFYPDTAQYAPAQGAYQGVYPDTVRAY